MSPHVAAAVDSAAYRDLKEQCDGHHRYLYVGNGKKALNVRMELVEENLGKLLKNMRAVIFLLLTMIGTLLVDIFVRHH